jgi:hypothetical protein
MRVSGIPSLGSGVVFPILEERITVEPFKIPEHWHRIIGIDLGFDHPNAIACIAWDNETDTYYLYDEYSQKGDRLNDHAMAIRSRGGDRIPVVVPHDAFKHDSVSSGKKIIDLLGEYGLNLVREPFSNPPGADGKNGGNSVEFGVNWMMKRMEEGKLKVFSTCTKFLQELKIYHRKDGKIIDRNDDMISATRYGLLMMSRHGRPGSSIKDPYYYPSTSSLVPSWHAGVI